MKRWIRKTAILELVLWVCFEERTKQHRNETNRKVARPDLFIGTLLSKAFAELWPALLI